MEKINYSKWFWIGLFIVVGYTVFAQTILSIPAADNFSVFTISQYLLSGKKYYYDFFEINPPLIFWITTPAVLLHQWLHLNFWFATLIFNFMVWAATFFLCGVLLSKIFVNEHKIQQWILFFIAITTLLLPKLVFAEREALAFMLVLPYLFLVGLRLQKKNPPAFVFVFWVALFAAVGFSLKPYFLLCFVLVEVFYVAKTRTPQWNRIEFWIVPLFFLGYLVSIAAFTPAYYEKILPLMRLFYLHYSSLPALVLLRLSIAPFAVLGLSLLMGFSILFSQADDFLIIFILSAVGFYVGALSAGQYWYYHFLPADQCIFIAILYFLLMLVTNKKNFSHWKTGSLLLLTFLAVVELELSLDYSDTYAMRYRPTNSFYTLSHTLPSEVHDSSVYLLTNIASYRGLLIYFAHIHFVGRFGIVQLIAPLSDETLEHQKNYSDLKNEVISIMVADIEKNSPQYLMIDQDGYWLYENGDFIHKSYFSFLRSNPRLNAIFKQYCFSQQIINFALFRRCV